MRKLLIHVAACAALVNFGLGCGGAQAGSVAFGQGSWQPAIVFRQLFDCLYNQAQGGGAGAVGISRPGAWPKAKSCASFNGSNFGGEILYEGNGFSDYRSNFLFGSISEFSDPFDNRLYSFFELLFGVVTYTDTSLGLSSTAQYDGLQFIAGESPVDAAEVAAWNKYGNPAKFGNIVQFPVAASPIALAFAGTDGNGHALNILQPTPPGGSSGLNLSRNALCGIYSGHITRWNNPILTALNGGVLGSGQITVVVSDGGPNFPFDQLARVPVSIRNRAQQRIRFDPRFLRVSLDRSRGRLPAPGRSGLIRDQLAGLPRQ
jgi:phosphate transport system substrate-binding protein